MQAQPFSPTLGLNGQNGFPLFQKGSKSWFQQPFMDYLIHTVFLFTGSEKKEDEMLDGIPLTFLSFFFFSSWKPSLSQQTRSWHTHITAFCSLVKCYWINILHLVFIIT